jgi:hypothetical protein
MRLVGRIDRVGNWVRNRALHSLEHGRTRVLRLMKLIALAFKKLIGSLKQEVRITCGCGLISRSLFSYWVVLVMRVS